MNKVEPKIVADIVNDITTTQLSSYQIAFKYGVYKHTVDKLGRSHLGDAIYDKKEELAYIKLVDQVKELQQQEVSTSQIAQKLGVSKSTMFKIIDDFSKVNSDQQVQIISVEHPEENIKEENENSSSSLMPVPDKETENFSYGYRNSYKSHRRNHERTDFAKIQVNGIQISFNPNQENIFETISKIMSVLQE